MAASRVGSVACAGMPAMRGAAAVAASVASVVAA